uniref:Uncharacterized protein n=1 Tax=Avena sativa TaxID=4498 RepID=A0ACD5XEF8_AVESA
MESSAVVPGAPPLLPYAYAPLPSGSAEGDAHGSQSSGCGMRWRACATVVVTAVLVVVTVLAGARVDLTVVAGGGGGYVPALTTVIPRSRGKDSGESEKASGADGGFPWSSDMLQWQRPGFHFQPEKHYMNDPNGPVYYGGWYHLFYQHNPKGDSWGNISWGHAVSKDMLHWRHLPIALVPDHWYDINGVLTGSITMLPDGRVVLLYTGNTDTFAQVQCLATPADPSDPLLRSWIKHPANPILLPPPGIGLKDFRDPLTAWFDESDKTWRTLIGSKDDNGHAGIVLSYKTTDFINYELMSGNLHRGPNGTGMYECIDIYPVGGNSSEMLGGNSSPEVLFVLKESANDEWHDYYALGSFDAATNKWTPQDPEADLGVGLRYDWGKYYASKSFYDKTKNRRIVWAYVGKTDSEQADRSKGWASLMSIPRTVELDKKTRTNLIQWPVEEIETLRKNATDLSGITVAAGSVVRLPLHQGAQLDIVVSFRLNSSDADALNEADVGYNCSSSGGAAMRGALGPFGLLVLADGRLEQTAVYFYVSKGLDGGLETHFCHDESRSTRAKDIVNRVVGSIVPVLDGEAFSARVLVDHSIVQSFVMGGRLTATSRAYPTEAIYDAAGVYLFNNATSTAITVEGLVVYDMASAESRAFLADDM